VRFLVDNALSPQLGSSLREAGHDAVHVRDRGLASADDEAVLELADRELRVLISADTDFGTLLSTRRTPRPSLILFRHGAERRPLAQARLLLVNLDALRALVTIEPARLRVRTLPLF
jgi:predicted nuclease of predicted toxin-antitoxin system